MYVSYVIMFLYPGHAGRKRNKIMTPYEIIEVIFLGLTFSVTFATLIVNIINKQ